MEKTKKINAVFMMLILLSGVSYAGCLWTGAVSNAWSNASNWSGGFPSSAVDVSINGQNIPVGGHQLVIASGVSAQASRLFVGSDTTSVTVTLAGGTLTQSDSAWLGIGIGCTTGNTSFFNISSGSADLGATLMVGFAGGTGYLNMSGGSIYAPHGTVLGQSGGIGYAQLNGGELKTGGLTISSGSADIRGGKLILWSDQSAAVQSYVNNGLLTGYGSASNIVISLTANPGWTTVTAIPEPATILLLGSALLGLRKRK